MFQEVMDDIATSIHANGEYSLSSQLMESFCWSSCGTGEEKSCAGICQTDRETAGPE